MTPQSPRGREQRGGSAALSPPQDSHPPCERPPPAAPPATDTVVTKGHHVHNNILSECPRQYCVRQFRQNILSELSRVRPVWFLFSLSPQLRSTRGREGPPPPWALSQTRSQPKGGGVQGAARHRHAGALYGGGPDHQHPGGQMDARRTCCWLTNKYKDHGGTADTSAPPSASVQCSVQKRSRGEEAKLD